MKEAVPEQDLLIQSWLGGRRGGGAAGESDGVVEGLLFATAADGDPEELVAAFDRLAAWVDNSLDIYKVRRGGRRGGRGGAASAAVAALVAPRVCSPVFSLPLGSPLNSPSLGCLCVSACEPSCMRPHP